MAAHVAAEVSARRAAMLAPPAGHCLTCAKRWGKQLLDGECVCTGHISLYPVRPFPPMNPQNQKI